MSYKLKKLNFNGDLIQAQLGFYIFLNKLTFTFKTVLFNFKVEKHQTHSSLYNYKQFLKASKQIVITINSTPPPPVLV